MNIFIIGLDVVDVFFMISGFLTFHLEFFPMKKMGVIYLPLSIMFRWLRMMPVFGLLLLFVIQILPFLSEGPWWNYRILPEIETCRRTWVFDILAIENFTAHQQCLLISWYLSVDIQLSILGGILLLIVTKYRKIGMGVIAATFFIFTEFVGIKVYKKKYYGVLRLFLNSISSIREKEEFHKLYTSSVSRAPPYLIGFMAAFLTNILKAKRYTFSTRQTALIPLGLSLIGVASICYGLVLYNTARRYNVLENIIYAVLHRTLFVLPVASLLCIYFTSGLGKFNKVFEMKIFVPFGRLIYSAFLVHYVIQLYHVSSQRELPLVPEKMNRVYWWISDIVCSYTVAFFVYMMCEGPIYSLTKFLQSYLTRTSRRISIRVQGDLDVFQNGFQNKAYHDDEEVIQEMTPREDA